MINELGQTYVERAKLDRREPDRQRAWLQLAVAEFAKTLVLDTENVTAHYNLALIHAQLGDETRADEHRRLHERFRRDDNARDRAIAAARRRDAAADHAAQAIVIYPLQRIGAPGLHPAETRQAMREP